ncbi:hypothetical protein [Jatrophihabitans sp. GAS493]|uniref:hypothetical protein n=1 Tax=Jatrophihabitans sp. GAS493 TaxID=1907575 RepID=UPI0012FD978A|nr:hypothetical protein [Jatrophihabitans sp. GAS493]
MPAALAGLFVLVVAGVASASPTPTLSDGTVSMFADNDGKPLFTVNDMAAGQVNTACTDVTVENAGAGDTVAFAGQQISGPLAKFLTVTVVAGPADANACGAFSGTEIYHGPLTGLAVQQGKGVVTGWLPKSAPTWRFRITVQAAEQLPLVSTAEASFAWHYNTGSPAAIIAPTPRPSVHPTVSPRPAAVAPHVPPPPSGNANLAHRPENPTVTLGRPEQPWLSQAVSTAGAVSAALLRHPQYPLVLLALAFAFFIAQESVDRRDPKLALAPVRNDDLRFTLRPSEVQL